MELLLPLQRVIDNRATSGRDLEERYLGLHIAEGMDYRSRHQIRIKVLVGADNTPWYKEQAFDSILPVDGRTN